MKPDTSDELTRINNAIGERMGNDLYVIVKQGFYYRPGAHGYTSCLCEAWQLPKAEAQKYEMYADRSDVPNNEKVTIQPVPARNWSGDPVAALSLVDRLKEERWSCQTFHNAQKEGVEVQFYRHKSFGFMNLYEEVAPTFAEAISRCALKVWGITI